MAAEAIQTRQRRIIPFQAIAVQVQNKDTFTVQQHAGDIVEAVICELHPVILGHKESVVQQVHGEVPEEDIEHALKQLLEEKLRDLHPKVVEGEPGIGNSAE